MSSRAGKLETLEVGRALAALAVVLDHASLAANSFTASSHNWFAWGGHGVDFFFVLSGFIIFHVHRHDALGLAGARAFMAKRLRRIYVPYLPASLVLIGLYLAFPGVSEGNRDWSWITSLTLIPTGHPPALSVAWTLSYEMVFYTFFLLFFATRRFAVICIAWALVLLAVLVTGGRSGMVDPLPGMLLRPIILEFLAGMAAAWSLEKVALNRAPLLILAGLSGILAFALAGNVDRTWLGLAIAPLVLGIAVMDAHRLIRPPRFLVFLGGASYAIYLVHNPVVSVSVRVLDHWHSWSLVLVGCSLAGTAAGIVYHAVYERPALAWLRRHGARNRPHELAKASSS